MSSDFIKPPGKSFMVGFDRTPEYRKSLPSRLVFAEERSEKLMAHTLSIFKSSYEQILLKKKRFDAFNFDPEDVFELIAEVIPGPQKFSVIHQELERRGVIRSQRVSRSSDAADVTVAIAEDIKLVSAKVAEYAKSELGENPGGRVFVNWLLTLVGLIETKGDTKSAWFEKKSEFVDDLAYDYARYGLTPHEEIYSLSPAFVSRFNLSYKAASAQYGSNTKPHNPFIRKWIALRKSALVRGRSFDPAITPDILKTMSKLDYCPVSGVKLEVAPIENKMEDDNRWSVERHCNELGYTLRNITLTSNRVNKIRGSLNAFELFERAAGAVHDDRLSQIEWCRLANLHKTGCSYAEPYLSGVFHPVVWVNAFVDECEEAETAGAMLALLCETTDREKRISVSEAYFREFIRKHPEFSAWDYEKVKYEVGNLYSVLRQQLKNSRAQSVNFAALFDAKRDSQKENWRVYSIKLMLDLLAVQIFGEEDASCSSINTSSAINDMRKTLAVGKFTTSGYL